MQIQGDIIKATGDYRNLTQNEVFWKEETALTLEALKFIKEFKKMKPYDTFNIKPDAYDMKTTGGPEDDKDEKKKAKKESGGPVVSTGKKKGKDDSDDEAAFTKKA